MKQKIPYILLLLLNVFATVAIGQTNFYATGKRTAYTGQTYTINFTLKNIQGKNLKLPQNYPGFNIVGGPNQSSNYQWINGKTTRTISYSFYLQPIKEGKFKIPEASIEVDGKTITTQQFEVEVKKGNQPTQAQGKSTTPQSNKQQNNGDWKKQVSENMFVKMYTNKNKPYVGEQVNIYIKLYQRINTYNTQLLEIPKFEGFWKHDFKLEQSEWKQEELDGVKYNTILLNKYALFPQREGTFTLEPVKMQTLVRLRTQGNPNSIFDQFFGSYENKIYEFQSNKLGIQVKPLPLENQPEDFYGAVGKFEYKARLDSLTAKTGNAVTLKTSIVGTGNIMMIDAPKLSFDEEKFELFDPESKEFISKRSNYINGTKKYNYQLIPLKPGNYALDPISFSYFDLQTKQYKTIYTDTLKLGVSPSADYIEEVVVADHNNDSLEVLKPIAAFLGDQKSPTFIISKKEFILFCSSPIFLAFLLFVVKRRKDNYEPDWVSINRKKANKVALQKLKQAHVYLKAKDQKAFYNEVIRSLWDYVSLKLDIEKENLSKSNINEKLLAQKVSETLANEYLSVIQNCEMAIYTPTTDVAMQEDFDRTKDLIINLENVL